MVPGRPPALAHVGVKRELGDHEDRGTVVEDGALVAQDPQLGDLPGEPRDLLRAVVVRDAHEGEQARSVDRPDHLPADRHRRTGDPLEDRPHQPPPCGPRRPPP
nr:hypothetical protein DA06_11685 [Georgenia sp. SUBG003]